MYGSYVFDKNFGQYNQDGLCQYSKIEENIDKPKKKVNGVISDIRRIIRILDESTTLAKLL